MTGDREALGTVIAAIDEGIRPTLDEGEDPSWLLMCSGQVMRTTLVRRRPNGTVWIEAKPVEVEGVTPPPALAEKLEAARALAEVQCQKARTTLELRRRTAVAIAQAEGLKEDLLRAEAAEALAPVLGNMSAAQLDGQACAYCHTPATQAGAMVPLKVLAGLEFTGAHHTLFVCDPDCRKPEAEPIEPRPCMHNGYHRPGHCPEAEAERPIPGPFSVVLGGGC